jgi:hypothetical protein
MRNHWPHVQQFDLRGRDLELGPGEIRVRTLRASARRARLRRLASRLTGPQRRPLADGCD